MGNMNSDFFDGLSETITRRARGIGEKAESFYEIQRMRNKLHAEERLREKALSGLGYLVYTRFCESGEVEDEEMAELCRMIQKHDKIISRCKSDISRAKGEKNCPSCGKAVASEAAFCPYCGASFKNDKEDIKEEIEKEEASEQEIQEEAAEQDTAREAEPEKEIIKEEALEEEKEESIGQ